MVEYFHSYGMIFVGSRNYLGWAKILTYPFERWTRVLKSIPLDGDSFRKLYSSYELRFCLKKWIGEMVILVVVYYGWLPKFLSRWNGLLIWMAFVLYIQPTLEGTLVGALANLLGVFFGALIGGLLMSFPIIAMNSILLDAYLMISTFFAAYFINSSYSITVLNIIITQYVVILGQYNPLEYEANWYVPIGRCIMMSIGTIIAVMENEYLWPFSAILQIRHSLASCLLEMSSIHSQLLNLAFGTITNSSSLEGRRVSISNNRSKKAYQTIPEECDEVSRNSFLSETFQTCRIERGRKFSMSFDIDRYQKNRSAIGTNSGVVRYGFKWFRWRDLWCSFDTENDVENRKNVEAKIGCICWSRIL